MILFIEQILNGLQLGITLFLMSAGLTLVFGIMQVINLAHGSFYMIGAYVGATVVAASGSFILGIIAALAAAGLVGMAVEVLVLRQLYRRDHLDQVGCEQDEAEQEERGGEARVGPGLERVQHEQGERAPEGGQAETDERAVEALGVYSK